MYPCRGVLHTPHKHPVRDERTDHESKNDCPFLSGMIEGCMQYAPTQAHLYHTSIKYVYPCRTQKHTPHKHPTRDEHLYHESSNDYTAPAWPIRGRMLYDPTQAHLYHPSIKCVYPCRGILHTPHKHPVRDEYPYYKTQNDCPFLLGMIEGRMQYAPT